MPLLWQEFQEERHANTTQNYPRGGQQDVYLPNLWQGVHVVSDFQRAFGK